MERRKLTKEDIDKVRDIEGFPIGTDEDIIALSDAPYYTACPNPFIEDFIKEYGTPYDEETDDYHREPFTADVSEGKHDPLYMIHSYHTKVPFKAIMRYILHYTEPGDVVLDAFCGTGMTGVAAQLCGDFKTTTEIGVSKKELIGERNAILIDLSPEATFIAHNYNKKVDVLAFNKAASDLLDRITNECGWVYETGHPGSMLKGEINYTIWSEIYICPNCSKEINYWDASVELQNGSEKTIKNPVCPFCNVKLKKADCAKSMESVWDERTSEFSLQAKNSPVRIAYSIGKKRYTKVPDADDMEVINKVKDLKIESWYPSNLMMNKGSEWGDQYRAGYHAGITRVSHFYTKRNIYVLAKCYEFIEGVEDESIKTLLKFWVSSIYSRSHKLNRYMPDHHRHVGPLSGTLYIPSFQAEINIISLLRDKLESLLNLAMLRSDACVSTQSATSLDNIGGNTIDYVFVDPPFGDNLQYSELNFIQEAWLKVMTNNTTEAIMNNSQGKKLSEYQSLMQDCFTEFYRVLKPNHWMTVEFHNSKNAVWNAIQEAIQRAGFVIADVRTLDKQKGTTKQLSYTSTVKQDLVISAYKPRDIFHERFIDKLGSEESAWEFVRQHLSQLPVVVDADRNGKIDVLAERQAFLLFDRMVAYHIMQGAAVPLDASAFYKGLDEHFLNRDNMYFLPDQVNEYDLARASADVEEVQLAYLVTDERSAIQWLYNVLKEPSTYQDIMPKFMKAMQALDKHEKMPELAEILEENFLKDDEGKWYIPDLTKSGDIAKLREKNLLKEFQEYLESKGRLKVFRSEAVRAGFAKLWKDKDYKSIVSIAERLPEKIIQEDPNLLMYYDISLSRV